MAGGPARLHRLPRRRVGATRPRRPAAVREALPGGVPVRALLADHPAQAGELPGRLRRLRPRGRGRVRRARDRGAAAGRRDHPPPGEDRGHHQQRRPGAGADRGVRLPRHLSLVVAADGAGAGREGPVVRRSSPARPPRPPSARTSRSGAGGSSAPPPSTPSCRPWAWSTTTPRAANGAAPEPSAETRQNRPMAELSPDLLDALGAAVGAEQPAHRGRHQRGPQPRRGPDRRLAAAGRRRPAHDDRARGRRPPAGGRAPGPGHAPGQRHRPVRGLRARPTAASSSASSR